MSWLWQFFARTRRRSRAGPTRLRMLPLIIYQVKYDALIADYEIWQLVPCNFARDIFLRIFCTNPTLQSRLHSPNRKIWISKITTCQYKNHNHELIKITNWNHEITNKNTTNRLCRLYCMCTLSQYKFAELEWRYLNFMIGSIQSLSCTPALKTSLNSWYFVGSPANFSNSRVGNLTCCEWPQSALFILECRSFVHVLIRSTDIILTSSDLLISPGLTRGPSEPRSLM